MKSARIFGVDLQLAALFQTAHAVMQFRLKSRFSLGDGLSEDGERVGVGNARFCVTEVDDDDGHPVVAHAQSVRHWPGRSKPVVKARFSLTVRRSSLHSRDQMVEWHRDTVLGNVGVERRCKSSSRLNLDELEVWQRRWFWGKTRCASELPSNFGKLAFTERDYSCLPSYLMLRHKEWKALSLVMSVAIFIRGARGRSGN